jgi:alginate O-acetyltransferase complex protein AlgI
MLYNSFTFIFGFLPLCLLLYFIASRFSRRLANIVLTIMSVFFYAWWNWHNVPILAGSILFNYAVGMKLRSGAIPVGPALRTVSSDAEATVRGAGPAMMTVSDGAEAMVRSAGPTTTVSSDAEATVRSEVPIMMTVLGDGEEMVLGADPAGPRSSKALLIAGITANLALLGYFKYANFGIANLAALTGGAIAAAGVPLHIVLPLGISFFTFTQIAFLVDAWRGEAGELDFWRYGLFVTFFPHLIAGPIVHHRELMPQFAREPARWWNARNVNLGIAFFALGLFKKVALADTLAPWANEVFKAAGPVDLSQSWRGALAYTLQLYFDFSGYCDMAIGLGLLFNVRLPDNFDAPYRAASIADFWRRWHMTLSRFLRDYLYIPLGGSRKGEPRRHFNLLITMLLGGLWHGAGWTFIVWGLYHGVLLVLHRAWSSRRPPLPALLCRPITFLAVVVGWVVFRSDTLRRAGSLLASMAGLHGAANDPSLDFQLTAIGLLILFVNIAPTTQQWVESRTLNSWRGAAIGTLLFFALLCMRTSLVTHRPSEFLYFQF